MNNIFTCLVKKEVSCRVIVTKDLGRFRQTTIYNANKNRNIIFSLLNIYLGNLGEQLQYEKALKLLCSQQELSEI